MRLYGNSIWLIIALCKKILKKYHPRRIVASMIAATQDDWLFVVAIG